MCFSKGSGKMEGKYTIVNYLQGLLDVTTLRANRLNVFLSSLHQAFSPSISNAVTMS